MDIDIWGLLFPYLELKYQDGSFSYTERRNSTPGEGRKLKITHAFRKGTGGVEFSLCPHPISYLAHRVSADSSEKIILSAYTS